MNASFRICWMLCLLGPLSGSALAVEDFGFFESQVRPLLVEHCLDCHSGAKTKGGLALDTKDGWVKGGDSGPAIVPGDLENSLLIKAVRYHDSDFAMPPQKNGGKLTDAKIALLERWVQMGAPDPRVASVKIAGMKAEEARSWWAFQRLPKVDGSTGGSAGVTAASARVDGFLESRLKAEGLPVSAAADKRTLLRRVSYDLTGLPPSAEEVEAFVADTSPESFSKVVERLLASPQYGVKWGRHWLDVVRYTDLLDARTADKVDAGDTVDAWRYRDWVVNAFNANLPYDQFVSHQIAGDLLARAQWDPQKLIATGVYAIGSWGNGDADKEKVHTDLVDDQVDLTSRAFLGLTMSCARCHDHKFDPLTTRDYYAMAGIFFSSSILEKFTGKGAGEKLMRIPIVSGEEEARLKGVRGRIAELDARMSEKLEPFGTVETQVAGHAQLSSWRGAGAALPAVIINSGSSRVSVKTWTLPPYSIAVHPGSKVPASINWRSPVSGAVKCSFELKDADPNCGDGIEWLLKRGERVLETGVVGNATTSEPQEFSAEVVKGDLLQLIVRPRSEYTCDMTQVDFKISDSNGKAWDVAQSLVSGAKQGQEDVWWICSGEGVSLGKDTPEGRALAAARQKAVAELEQFTFAQGLRDGGIAQTRYEGFHDVAVHKRGRYDTLGEVVPRGFPALLSKGPPGIGKEGSGRLELARWIASAENPLTARVWVNRVWQHHFGEGIVRTPNNFGKLGAAPTHPELLNWLASYFVQSGWKTKDLHRVILHSAAYQRSAVAGTEALQRDPDNRFFSHQNRHRLTAEEMRDSLLWFAGKLELKLGGKAEADLMNPRRTLYLRTLRSDRSNYQALFDGADPTVMVEKRVEATVAPQALFLLNHPFSIAQAEALAAMVSGEGLRSPEVISSWLWRRLFQREPTSEERALAVRALGLDPDLKTLTSFCQMLLCSNETAYVD